MKYNEFLDILFKEIEDIAEKSDNKEILTYIDDIEERAEYEVIQNKYDFSLEYYHNDEILNKILYTDYTNEDIEFAVKYINEMINKYYL